MRVGISLTSAHATDDVRRTGRWMVERARAANEAGLDSLFVGDHHSTGAPYYQNTPVMGRLLAEWGERPFGCLFLLPLWNPVLVAEQIGTLAALGQGRFIMQCALGADERQFAAMGVDMKYRPSLFEESLSIVRALLAGKNVSGSRRFLVKDARVSPRPPEPVEVWVGGDSEPAIDRAARLGDGWLAGPELTPEEAWRLVDVYKERCYVHRRQPAAVAIRRDVYVGASSAEARTVAEPILAAGYRGFDPSACVYGSIEDVAEQLHAYGDHGFTDVIVRHLTDDQEQVLGSMARLAHVRELLAG
jgi:alkanesulfonate monooxygenase SsuD/methylene tetrahydromethanopterin reductase-like flavin-dependent oxidoreductase (luciferase family)